MTTPAPLSGKLAIVTGGGRGIGRAVSMALAARGADIVLLGRTERTLKATAVDIRLQSDVAIHARTLDVTDGDAVDLAFAGLITELGPPDILINNAGGTESAPFTGLDRDNWDATLALNLTSVYACTHAVLPAMLEAGYGRIVNVASTAGLAGFPYVAAYCAAKHGVVGLTRALALEVADKGINVNAVCPGFTDTDMLQESIRNIAAKTGRTEAEARDELAATNAHGQLIRPEEVADMVVALCGPAATSVTGQTIEITGEET
ncbi:MAG: SDR family oxidoreductase [Rhodospirillaceae bacterium]|jgi:NAD(P)-dependent dehydrogenase (short-subunit alcohol dehydrogenase family)|nr:SDR family oxidoreductase [Rhodospirillaceae bacterium]MBT3811139.1 SDR family oxidoreductase [Rhodospirillaceae bacterium]MBT3931314.1 SDR family oxidoreductase [Rhodospirillaceae bacterium]MBT4772203.1 SDR family oxidoreductase [Rhodospirillaceae bacterium]MBT5359490.1 SDR family oxidoreductase [Rhodospirillaceae bacterium]